MQLNIAPDKVQLGQRAAEHGLRLIRQTLEQQGSANIIVATGASQFEMLTHLIKATDIRWDRVTAFHLDEYVGMDLTHKASFRLYLWQRFVTQLNLPLKAFHYLDGQHDAPAEAKRVGAIIAQHPIDVAFVGIGENGHMAFNDPPADFATESPYLVVNLDENCRKQQLGEGWFPTLADVPKQAISMSIKQILKSKSIIVSVPDKRKAQAVKDSVERPIDPRYPSTCLQPHPDVTIYMDSASSSLLSDKYKAEAKV